VFLVQNEDEEIAKVLDFGVAKVESHALAEGTRTRTGSILGTPYYMSPEQAQGNRTVDSRTDLWAMGVIAFECLTGKRPFYSDGLGDLVLAICVRDIPVPSELASVPIGFDAWWHRAVARDPEKRFQTAKELTESLREALGLEARDPARESPHAAPSIEFTSGPDTDPDAAPETPLTDPLPGAQVAAVLDAASRAVTVQAEAGVEENAQTVVAPPSTAVPAIASLATLTERQFGTTQRSPASTRASRSDGAGIVLGVAGAALFVGLIGGVLLLRARQAPPDPDRELPPPLPAAVRQPSDPKVRPQSPAPSGSAEADEPQLEFLPGDAPSALPSASASPTPTPTNPYNDEPGSGPADAGKSSASHPDGGWVKPSWAIPDDEPVRRPPVDDDEE
jgi:serine/threonine-protein kinase